MRLFDPLRFCTCPDQRRREGLKAICYRPILTHFLAHLAIGTPNHFARRADKNEMQSGPVGLTASPKKEVYAATISLRAIGVFAFSRCGPGGILPPQGKHRMKYSARFPARVQARGAGRAKFSERSDRGHESSKYPPDTGSIVKRSSASKPTEKVRLRAHSN